MGVVLHWTGPLRLEATDAAGMRTVRTVPLRRGFILNLPQHRCLRLVRVPPLDRLETRETIRVQNGAVRTSASFSSRVELLAESTNRMSIHTDRYGCGGRASVREGRVRGPLDGDVRRPVRGAGRGEVRRLLQPLYDDAGDESPREELLLLPGTRADVRHAERDLVMRRPAVVPGRRPRCRVRAVARATRPRRRPGPTLARDLGPRPRPGVRRL